MNGIEYEHESYGKPLASRTSDRSWAVSLIMKIGGKFIKTEEQASKVLIALAVIFFALSIYNFFF